MALRPDLSPVVLVTGASGFVGSALCSQLAAAGYAVRGVRRNIGRDAPPPDIVDPVSWIIIPNIGPDTQWDEALRGVASVVHLAASVHMMQDVTANPLAEFRRVNTLGTETLARAAARAGVKRFVFLSSIKVNGEETSPPHPSPLMEPLTTRLGRQQTAAKSLDIPRGERECFSETDPPSPQDPYAASKWEAEQALHRIAAETGMEVVVLRCPLVYGPGVKGNFLRLMQAVDRGIPLPLALAANHRSLIYLGNLISVIITCLERREAAGKTYLVSDGEDVSTAQLILQMAQALGRPARLWPCPLGLIKFAGRVTGKSDEVARLLGSLCIDSSKIRRELGWAPSHTLAQGLAETAAWYRRQV